MNEVSMAVEQKIFAMNCRKKRKQPEIWKLRKTMDDYVWFFYNIGRYWRLA